MVVEYQKLVSTHAPLYNDFVPIVTKLQKHEGQNKPKSFSHNQAPNNLIVSYQNMYG